MERMAVRAGLLAFSGVLAADQLMKAAGAAADGVDRVFAADAGVSAVVVGSFLATSVLLMWLARWGAVSPFSVGLVLGGLVSSVLDGLATGGSAGISLADGAVGVGVLLGLAQTLLHRPAIFGRSQRLLI
jgi:hypothetical protein